MSPMVTGSTLNMPLVTVQHEKSWVTSPRKRKLYAVVLPSCVPLCWDENIGQLTRSLTHSLRYCAHSKASSSVGSLPNSQPISFRNNQSGFWWWSTINDSYLLANPMFLRATGGKPKAKILVTQWPRQAIRSPPIYALTRGCLLTIFFDHWTSWSADPQTCAPP